MKRFLYKFIAYLALPFIVFIVYIIKFDNGSFDSYYLKFTSPRQYSLILGTSRAEQGIVPGVIQQSDISNYYQLPVYNYAFTLLHSPYGPVYLKSLEKKLEEKKGDKKGLFILAVDPWCLSSAKDAPEDETIFREKDQALDKMVFVNVSPNIEYLVKFFNKKWITEMGNRESSLHADGWLEVNVPMDSVELKKRKDRKFHEYIDDMLAKLAFSKTRQKALVDMIQLFKKYGDVYLIRIPVGKEIYHIEQEYMPTFDIHMKALCDSYQVNYMDFNTRWKNFRTTDGDHLYKEDAKRFTAQLCDSIYSCLRDVKR